MAHLAPVLIPLLALLAGCAFKPAHRQSYVELETPHFQVVSSLGPQGTIELARDLESFVDTIEFVAGESLTTAAAKTRVLAFDDRTFTRHFDQNGVSGYFLPSLDGGTMVLRTGGGWRDDASEDLRHHYAHYLIRNHHGLDLPLWYDEGLAVYASTIDIDDGFAEIGRHRRDHLVRLRSSPWISLSRLLESEHTADFGARDRELFDSQAWVLIHSMNAKERSKFQKQLSAYLEDVESGTPAKEALTKNFGASFFGFQKSLQQYVRQDRLHSLSVKLNHPWELGDTRMTDVPEDRIASELGWLSLALDRPEQALRYFAYATELVGKTALTDAGVGTADSQMGEWESAKANLERAIAKSPDDARIQLAVADFYLAQAESVSDATTRQDLATRGLKHGRRALELEPESGAALAAIAELMFLADQIPLPGEGPALEAGQKMPSSVEAELLRARHHMALGNPAQARQAARNAHSRSHSKATQAAAEEILREINLQVAGP